MIESQIIRYTGKPSCIESRMYPRFSIEVTWKVLAASINMERGEHDEIVTIVNVGYTLTSTDHCREGCPRSFERARRNPR